MLMGVDGGVQYDTVRRRDGVLYKIRTLYYMELGFMDYGVENNGNCGL